MRRSSVSTCWSRLVIGVSLYATCPITVAVPPATLCLSAEDRCNVVGARVRAFVSITQTDVTIISGQTVVAFDPNALELLDAHPGAECDPASPFVITVSEEVDRLASTVLLGVGVAPGGIGASGPSTLACFDFLVLDAPDRELCLIGETGPTFLVDDSGNLVPVVGGDNCPSGGSPSGISCTEVAVYETCQCGRAPPDCGDWDTDCTVGECRNSPAECVPIPAHEGGPCDDGFACTQTDRCEGGRCLGFDCPNPSVCLSDASGCSVGTVNIRLTMGSSESPIVGGQFALRYDPALVDLITIEPGENCDPASPFVLELYESVDRSAGTIAYAVGLNPIFLGSGASGVAGGQIGTHGPATLACLRFGVLQTSVGEVCLIPGDNPLRSLLVDDLGMPIWIDNGEDCPSDPGSNALSCGTIDVRGECKCTSDQDCSVLTTDCQVGLCDLFNGRCKVVPANEGGACDDGDSCTAEDRCSLGQCLGSECDEPSLCVITEDACVALGQEVSVTIRLGEGSSVIVGGQFSLRYDANSLEFLGIEPGSVCDPLSPFSLPIFQSVSEGPEGTGEIFYAVGVNFFEPGTQGPAAMACLRFRVLLPLNDEICLINNLNPLSTILVDDHGQAVRVNNAEDCPTPRPSPIMSCDGICVPIPALHRWGMVTMTLLLLVAAKHRFHRRSRTGPSNPS